MTTLNLCFVFNFKEQRSSLTTTFSLFSVLQKAFNSFDSSKTGSISTETVAEILRLMGQPFNKKILDEMIEEVDEDSEWSDPPFCRLY